MTILPREEMPKQSIDLSGPDGNAFTLLGTAKNLCEKLDDKDWHSIEKDMTAADYEHLLEVFEREFGLRYRSDNLSLRSFVDLYR